MHPCPQCTLCSALELYAARVRAFAERVTPCKTWAQGKASRCAALRSGPGALLVSLLDGTLVSLDPLTGAELWAEPFDSGQPLIRSVPAEAPGAPAPPVGYPGGDPMAGNSLAAVFPGLDGALYAYADGGGARAGEAQPRGLQVRPRAAGGCGRPPVCDVILGHWFAVAGKAGLLRAAVWGLVIVIGL